MQGVHRFGRLSMRSFSRLTPCSSETCTFRIDVRAAKSVKLVAKLLEQLNPQGQEAVPTNPHLYSIRALVWCGISMEITLKLNALDHELNQGLSLQKHDHNSTNLGINAITCVKCAIMQWMWTVTFIQGLSNEDTRNTNHRRKDN